MKVTGEIDGEVEIGGVEAYLIKNHRFNNSSEGRRLNNTMDKHFIFLNKDSGINKKVLWKSHRDHITMLLEKVSGSSERDSVIVFGAGNCDDIDLVKLTELFNRVVLVDIDTDSMQSANDPLPNGDKIEIFGGIEFTGIEKINFTNNFVSLLKKHATVNEIMDFILNVGLRLSNQHMYELFQEKYSLVVSCPVYTQMFIPYAWILLDANGQGYSQNEKQDILLKLADINTIIIKQYNDLLESLVANNGRILVWSDQFEFTDANMDEFVITDKHMREGKMPEIYSYLASHEDALTAGFQGIGDLGNRLNNKDHTMAHWFWHFDESKSYFTTALGGSLKKQTSSSATK